MSSRARASSAEVRRLRHEGEDYVVIAFPIRRPPAFATLSRAEVSVVEDVLDGRPHREIARARGVSLRTVSNQLARAYRKLGVRSATELALLVRDT